ncbi:1-phosphofructokinase family hexose kinase [Allohahella marinimesophila]|uniref:Phosphofructokinase n=1 Tax=Allohahella marinimesophila TaxID=1054972 RepID=A0ABP7P254_9GAMM
MAEILCIALNPTIDISCTAERVQPTHKIRTSSQVRSPGGGGVNVARVISRLGGEAELLYCSGGATGKLLDDSLQDLPFDLLPVQIDEPTRIAFMVAEQQSGFEYRFVPDGPSVNSEDLASIRSAVAGFSGRYIVASGSLPPGAPVDTYAVMAREACRKGQRLVLDTSGEALKHTLDHAAVYLAKPSLRELESYIGHSLNEAGARAAAMTLVERGAATYVAVSMGAQGAFLASADGVLRMSAPRVVVRSAVGAGDSFVAAMVTSFAAGHDVKAAFLRGMAAGAAAVMTEGTELCRPEDIDEIYQHLKPAPQ